MKKKYSTPIFLALFAISLMSSCKNSNLSSKGNTAPNQKGFIGGDIVTKDETYQSIVNSTARFQAMFSGEYIQKIKATDDNGKEYYKPCLVNDGMDSTMLYIVPIGDPNKDGYWLYGSQRITSLPNDPIHQWVNKIESINRDTIAVYAYVFPPEFEPPLSELIKKHRNIIEDMDLSRLEKSTNVEYYVRQTPLHYICTSTLLQRPNHDSYYKAILEIQPASFSVSTRVYADSLTTESKKNSSNIFIKQRLVR